jgi:hypothetical protein
MGPAYPPRGNQARIEQSPRRADEYTFHEQADNVLSLLEENERLRGLVVRLSTIILKSVAEK